MRKLSNLLAQLLGALTGAGIGLLCEGRDLGFVYLYALLGQMMAGCLAVRRPKEGAALRVMVCLLGAVFVGLSMIAFYVELALTDYGLGPLRILISLGILLYLLVADSISIGRARPTEETIQDHEPEAS